MSPNGVALASAMAWSRSSARISPSTGPKHSVRWKNEPGRTPSLMPGDQSCGLSGAGRGSSSHSSPSSRTVSARRSAAPGGWVSGVIRLVSSHALPTARLAAASRSWRRKSGSSYTSASQMARLAAEHFWPLWPKAERTRSRMA